MTIQSCNRSFLVAARLLVCSGTVLFLSADSCAFELISSLGSFSTPLVRVNQSPDCDIHAHQTSVITVPTVQPLTDVLPYVLRKLTAPKYLVFYDDDMGIACVILLLFLIGNIDLQVY